MAFGVKGQGMRGRRRMQRVQKAKAEKKIAAGRAQEAQFKSTLPRNYFTSF